MPLCPMLKVVVFFSLANWITISGYHLVKYTGLNMIQNNTYGKRNSPLQEEHANDKIWRHVWTIFLDSTTSMASKNVSD